MKTAKSIGLVGKEDGGYSFELRLDDDTTVDLSELVYRDVHFEPVGDVADTPPELGLTVTFVVGAALFALPTSSEDDKRFPVGTPVDSVDVADLPQQLQQLAEQAKAAKSDD